MGTPLKDISTAQTDQKGIEPYGKVILTLKNCTLPDEKLEPTPSSADGLEAEIETDLRILGCELMQTAGILLKLPQVAMATAQVLFHRFYFSKSFVRQNYEVTGMGCLYLASKIEEAPRRIRDVVNVYHHIKQVYCKKKLSPMLLDQNYVNLKYQVIKAERRVLKELGFCVHVKHPHKLIVIYLQTLGLETKQSLMQMAWNYMNDSLRTDVFVRYQPETIACACIYLSARKLKLLLPKSPTAWWTIFGVSEPDIQTVCVSILRLYQRAKPNMEELEKKVQSLAKKFEESRLKMKANAAAAATSSGNNTPNNVSSAASNAGKEDSKKSRGGGSPKRSRSRSKSYSGSPRYRRHKRSRSRSRTRSRSPDRYKKSYKSRRSSRSPTPNNKRDKRHRSRSHSYDEKFTKGGKYVSDRYKEDRYYDKYRRDEDRDRDRYSYDDDKYRNNTRNNDDDSKYRSNSDKSRNEKDDSRSGYRGGKDDYSSKRGDKERGDEDSRYHNSRNDDGYYNNSNSNPGVGKSRGRDDRRDDVASGKRKTMEESRSKEDENGKTRKDDHDSDISKRELREKDEKRSSTKSKHSGGSKSHKIEEKIKKKKKKHHITEDLDDDDIEIIHIKKEKKAR